VWELKQIKDLYLSIVAPRYLFIEFIDGEQSDSPLIERRKSFKFIRDLRSARSN